MKRTTTLITLLGGLMLGANLGYAEQPPFPCHANPNANQDMAAVAARGDIAGLPAPLQNQILRIAGRPHSQLPTQAFNEADGASQLFQYYLLDANGFEPNVFTTIFPGVNDHVQLTATGADGLLAPRFSPSTQAWVLSGTRVPVNPAVPGSTGRDADDR